jgi:hypothetical protein
LACRAPRFDRASNSRFSASSVSLEYGCETSDEHAARLASAESVDDPSGSYFSDGVATQPSPAARDPQTRAALWDESVRLAKL